MVHLIGSRACLDKLGRQHVSAADDGGSTSATFATDVRLPSVSASTLALVVGKERRCAARSADNRSPASAAGFRLGLACVAVVAHEFGQRQGKRFVQRDRVRRDPR